MELDPILKASHFLIVFLMYIPFMFFKLFLKVLAKTIKETASTLINKQSSTFFVACKIIMHNRVGG